MKLILVTAAVISEGDLFLMGQRSDGEEAGKWEFPGGKVEPGEDPRACLRRELREELGIEAEVGRVLEGVSALQNGRHLWVPRKDVGLLDKPPADRMFWENFQKLS